MGQAVRTTTGPRQLVARERDAHLLLTLEIDLFAAQQQILGGDDAEAAAGERVERGVVAVVHRDDARSQGERVGAVGPLLALLRDRVVASTKNRLEPRAPAGEAREEVLPGGPGPVLALEVDLE